MKGIHTLSFTLAFFSIEQTTLAAPSITLVNFEDEHCGNANGLIDVYVSGNGPFTYDWTGPGGFVSSAEDISGLAAGLYSLLVTDALFQTNTLNYTINNVPYLGPWGNPAQDSHANCPGHCWGEFRVPQSYLNGVAPFTYSEPVQGYDVLGEPYFYVPGGACGGQSYNITITDATGCSGDMFVIIVEPQIGSLPWSVTNITGSCTGGTNGTVSMSNVYDGNFFQSPALDVFDALGNYVTGQVTVGQNVTINNLAPGHYRAARNWNFAYQYTAYPCDDDSLGFDIPDLGVACGTVSGTAYIDNDQDCVQDVGEVGIPYEVLEITPGPTYAITNTAGDYLVDLGDGSYSLAQNDPTLIQICPASTPVPFTIASNAQFIDLADSSAVPLDLSASLADGAAHPGFNLDFGLQARNLSPQVSGAVTVTLTFDPALNYVIATPAPSSIAGNVLTWNLPAYTAYQIQNFNVTCMVPLGTALGTMLNSSLTVSNALSDANLANNSATVNTLVTGSFDPNTKEARTSSGQSNTQYFIGTDEWLDYTIRFQNTGTDTAFTVVVVDTLPAEVDPLTFIPGAASHPYEVGMSGDGIVSFTFNNILLPDSGTNEGASHGFVTFRVEPDQPELPGTTISNNAGIYFDFNPAVITNDAVVVLENSTQVGEEMRGGLLVLPNPAQDHIVVHTSTGIIERIDLTSADGRLTMTFAGGSADHPIDIAHLHPGAYVLIATLSDGTCIRSTFIKH